MVKKKDGSHLSERNRLRRNTAFDYINIVFMVFFCVTIAYPFLNTLAKSLSSDQAIMLGRVFVWPVDLSLKSYQHVINSSSFYYALRNTLFITVVGTLINLTITLTSGFAFARHVIGYKVLFLLVLFTMFFSGGIIPTYLLIRNLGLYDTHWAIILPSAFGAFNMILARNFFQNLPEEVLESSMIDGCNDLRMFIRIALPMSKPVIATLSLFVMVGFWNVFMAGVLYLETPRLQTLQMYVRAVVFQAQNALDSNALLQSQQDMRDPASVLGAEPIRAVVLMLATIPIVCVYPFLQKYFVHGINLGAVKE